MIIKHLPKQRKRFRHTILNFNGWRKTISDNDEDNLYFSEDVFSLCHKCKYLFHAVKFIHNYERYTIVECFKAAIQLIQSFESDVDSDDDDSYIHPKTVLCWYSIFNSNEKLTGCFNNNHKSPNGKTLLPMLFYANPEIKDAFMTNCYENLSNLSTKLLHEYLVSVCLPILLKRRQTENGNCDMTIKDSLIENGLRTFNIRTVQNWLAMLGFKYCACKKTIIMTNMRVRLISSTDTFS